MKPAECHQQRWEQRLNMGCRLLPWGRQGDRPFFPLLPKLPPLSGCPCQIVEEYLAPGAGVMGILAVGRKDGVFVSPSLGH